MPTRVPRFRWFVLFFVALVTALILVRWDAQRSIKPIPIATVVKQDIHSGVVTNGKAEAVEYRDMRTDIEGDVTDVPVHEGDEARQGQKLVEISQKQIASEVEHARAELADAEEALRLLKQGGSNLDIRELQSQLELAKRERDEAARLVAQNERLVQKGAVARVELDESRTRLAKAESQVDVLEQKLNHRYDPEEIAKAEAAVAADRAALNLATSRQRSSTVASPLRGTIFSLSVRPGDYVKPGDLLMRIGDFHKIRVRVYVDEPDLGRVRKGQPVLVTWDGLPGRQWRGVVDRLPSEIKEVGTRKVGEVSCILDNPDVELLPNMNLNVEIVTDEKPQVLTISRECLFGPENRRHVFVVQDGRLVARAVQTGISNLTRVEIRQGLKEGEEVAVASETPLREGMRVRNIED